LMRKRRGTLPRCVAAAFPRGAARFAGRFAAACFAIGFRRAAFFTSGFALAGFFAAFFFVAMATSGPISTDV